MTTRRRRHALYLANEASSDTEVVEVVAVHHDGPGEAYYTVRFADNRERQTVRTKLIFIH